MLSSVLAGAWLSAIAPAVLLAQDVQPLSQQPAPIVRSITISGTKEISTQALQSSLGVKVGEPLADPPQQLAQKVERQYREEGYAFARVNAEFDAASGSLALTVDEGVIDGVEFLGIDEKLVGRLADEFALRAGDVFNSRRAQEALEVLLRPTRGAIRPRAAQPRTVHDRGDLSGRRGTFDLADRNGERILLVGLREPAGRFRILPDLGEREDWFSPVDGFVPSLGMGIAVFDHDRFNHTFVSGHLSYKMASHRGGYALGFERPLFGNSLSIADPNGSATTVAAAPRAMPVSLELGNTNRVTSSGQYFVHVIATIGTLAEREVDEVGDAVFGRESETNSLGSLGRLVFRTVLKINDYLQSVSAEVRGRKTSGADILKPGP